MRAAIILFDRWQRSTFLFSRGGRVQECKGRCSCTLPIFRGLPKPSRPVRIFLSVSVVLLLAVGCRTADPKPVGLLDRDVFKDVLLEATLIEARMNHELIVAHQDHVPVEQYYADMFQEKGVTRAAFDASFTYYASRPEEMKAIYEEVLAELSRRKDEAPQPAEPVP